MELKLKTKTNISNAPQIINQRYFDGARANHIRELRVVVHVRRWQHKPHARGHLTATRFVM